MTITCKTCGSSGKDPERCQANGCGRLRNDGGPTCGKSCWQIRGTGRPPVVTPEPRHEEPEGDGGEDLNACGGCGERSVVWREDRPLHRGDPCARVREPGMWTFDCRHDNCRPPKPATPVPAPMPPGDDEALVLAMRVAFVRAATTDFINLNAPMRAALAVVREHDARREAGLLERAALLLKAGRYGVDDSDGKWMKWFEDRDAWLADARRRGGR